MKIIRKIFKSKQIEKDFGKLSVSKLQRKYNIGFSYAKNIMQALFLNGYIGAEDGYNPRKLLCEEEKVFQFIENNFASYRPIEYDEYYGKGNNSGTYDIPNKEVACNFDNMEGHDFEYFCADLLRKNGFNNVDVTQGSGDHGIDILAEKDDISYAIQCKCYSKDIGNPAVQQAHTGKSIYKRDVAVVLTNRYFTPQAQEEAEALGVKLWGRDKLLSLIKESNEVWLL